MRKYEDVNDLDVDIDGCYVDPSEISEAMYMKADGGGDDDEEFKLRGSMAVEKGDACSPGGNDEKFSMGENGAYSRSETDFHLTENDAYVKEV